MPADAEEISALYAAVAALNERLSSLEGVPGDDSQQDQQAQGEAIRSISEDVLYDRTEQVNDRRFLQLHIDEIYRRLRKLDEQQASPQTTCETSAGLTTLGTNAEGSASANSSSWALGSGPVDAWMTSRVVYDHAGSETLLGYKRKFSFDSCGNLIAVSGETEYNIDTPGECP